MTIQHSNQSSKYNFGRYAHGVLPLQNPKQQSNENHRRGFDHHNTSVDEVTRRKQQNKINLKHADTQLTFKPFMMTNQNSSSVSTINADQTSTDIGGINDFKTLGSSLVGGTAFNG